MRRVAAPSRRAVLALPATGLAAAGLGTLAAGCSTKLPTSAVEPPVDLAAAQAAAGTERALLARYDAAIASHPALTGLLAGLRAHHAQHLAALAALVPGVSTADPTTTPSAGGSSTPAASPAGGAGTPTGTPPGTATAPVDDSTAARASALAALAAAERGAAGAHRATCLSTTTRLAPLLASLYAAESCHADLLALGATG
ncbi:hypothetical protein [Pseudofrankia inefficax]|uniref:hypothetical protein n=1 Tax=Pseudofrankia inefficax (strain DSM 45817 / CECT 9037 / DDB 130130 / EuI1c) TaxID=298654 RepID=UPI0012FE1C69|nr:hypothetical protein [Pseudofrankia inefficax]